MHRLNREELEAFVLEQIRQSTHKSGNIAQLSDSALRSEDCQYYKLALERIYELSRDQGAALRQLFSDPQAAVVAAEIVKAKIVPVMGVQ